MAMQRLTILTGKTGSECNSTKELFEDLKEAEKEMKKADIILELKELLEAN